MTSMTMLPTTLRLLEGVRAALHGIRQSESLGAEAATRLVTLDLVLSEIMLRLDPEFYVQFYNGSRKLVEHGLERLRNDIPTAEREAMSTKLSALPKLITAPADFNALSESIASTLTILADLVTRATALDVQGDFVKQALAQELIYHERHIATVEPFTPAEASEDNAITRERVAAYLARKFPGRGLEVTSYRRLVGGFQKVTILLEVRDRVGKVESLVIRADKPGRFVGLDAGAIVDEYDIVRFVYRHGVPCAEPKWLETDPSHLGVPFMVTSRLTGKTSGSSIAADKLSDRALQSYAETLAAIHRVPAAELKQTCVGKWLQWKTLPENTAAAIECWPRQRWAAQIDPSPMTAHLLQWLRMNIPDDEGAPPCLLHVDYGPHNIHIENDRVTGVLDWESARVGDPAEDLAYLLLCLDDRADRQKMLAWYAAAGGQRVSEYRLRYFEVYNAIKFIMGGAFSSALFQFDTRASIDWCNVALFAPQHVASTLQALITAAESCPSRHVWRPSR
jgi:aminoglycoside phosphotransferase (APT) family kinase protein